MFANIECIALRTVKLSDSKNLLSAWSRQLGRITVTMPAGNSREARRRRAITCALATFEAVCDYRADREIQSLRDLKPMPGSIAMTADPLKMLSAQFLAEILDLLLKRSTADERLSEFLFNAIGMLTQITDRAALANFHLIFLYKLARHAGIEPRIDGISRRTVFDLRDACIRSTAPLHPDFIAGKECIALAALARADFGNAVNLPFDRHARRRTLDLIIQYYSIHLAPLSNLKSLAILREMG